MCRYVYCVNPVSKQRKNHDVSCSTSAMLSFAPHPLAPLSRGAGSFAAEGLRIRPINYQLLALRCGHRSLVGNGFIRSACYGFACTHRSGNRNNRIGTGVDALLKRCSQRLHTILFTINYSSFIIHWGGHRPPPFCLPLAELEGKMPLAADEV